MSTYVMSDIHGEYQACLKMLEKINFSNGDKLYVLGDTLDRGKNPVTLYLDLEKRENVCGILGNHEYMALECLEDLIKPITYESIDSLTGGEIEKICAWQLNGGVFTTDEFHKLSDADKRLFIRYLYKSDFLAEAAVGGRDYVLVHAGLDNFSPERPLGSYSADELIWHSPDYDTVYFEDKYLVTGHLPTAFIEDNPRSNKIFRKNNHIAIDCGASQGGNLGCLRLDDDKEFYIPCGSF